MITFDINQFNGKSEADIKNMIVKDVNNQIGDPFDESQNMRDIKTTVKKSINNDIEYMIRDITTELVSTVTDSAYELAAENIANICDTREDYLIDIIYELIKQNQSFKEEFDKYKEMKLKDISISPILLSRVINYLSACNDGSEEYQQLRADLNQFATQQMKQEQQNNSAKLHNTNSKIYKSNQQILQDKLSESNSNESKKNDTKSTYIRRDFDSFDDLKKFMHEFANNNDYAVSDKDITNFFDMMRMFNRFLK